MRMPAVVPFLGAVGCVFVMFIMNPTFGLIAVAVAVAIYIYILKRGVVSNMDDVRSGVFSAMAEWAAAKVTELSGNASARAWKPNLLIPIVEIDTWVPPAVRHFSAAATASSSDRIKEVWNV